MRETGKGNDDMEQVDQDDEKEEEGKKGVLINGASYLT